MSQVFSVDFEIMDEGKALVPVMDRGFLYGDSVYEAVRTYRSHKVFLLDRHFKRLLRSAGRIGLEIPFSLEKLSTHLDEVALKADNKNSYIRIIVSRGTDDRFDLFPSDRCTPRTIIVADHIHVHSMRTYQTGISVALVTIRRNLRTALDPNIKSGNYLNNMLALQEARKQGAQDAVMLNHQDCVAEGTTSNVFMVKAGVIYTPEMESGLLEGITRHLLLEVLAREKLDHKVQPISKEAFLDAEEVFLTGTTREIMPVTKVNGLAVGKGTPGPVTKELMNLFTAEVNRILKES